MHRNTTTVTHDVTIECVDPDGHHGLVEASFNYDPDEPFSVTVLFSSGDEQVPWTFARDLLEVGRSAPTGEGDVAVCPGLDEEGRAVTVLVLRGPEGSFVAMVRTRDLEAFLDLAYAVVPAGREHHHLDLDRELVALLG